MGTIRCRVSPLQTRSLRQDSGQACCFGKRIQNHVRPCAALWVPLRHRTESRWRGNSLRSNSPRREADSVRRLRRARRQEDTKKPYPVAKLGNGDGQRALLIFSVRTLGTCQAVEAYHRLCRFHKHPSINFRPTTGRKNGHCFLPLYSICSIPKRTYST